MFQVLGDNDEVLFETDTSSEAVRWLKQYTKNGDFGGYTDICVVDALKEIIYSVHNAHDFLDNFNHVSSRTHY